MITKAIVEKVIDDYTAKVRIPIYDSIETAQEGVQNKDLSVATICSLPNASCVVSKGDIVYVAFEDNTLSKPIIIGHLSKQIPNNISINVKAKTLEVEDATILSEKTKIGIIEYKDLLQSIKKLYKHKLTISNGTNTVTVLVELSANEELNSVTLLINAISNYTTISSGVFRPLATSDTVDGYLVYNTTTISYKNSTTTITATTITDTIINA